MNTSHRKQPNNCQPAIVSEKSFNIYQPNEPEEFPPEDPAATDLVAVETVERTDCVCALRGWYGSTWAGAVNLVTAGETGAVFGVGEKLLTSPLPTRGDIALSGLFCGLCAAPDAGIEAASGGAGLFSADCATAAEVWIWTGSGRICWTSVGLTTLNACTGLGTGIATACCTVETN